jgi:hypothetical protein
MKISLTNEEAEIVRDSMKFVKYDKLDPQRYYDAKLVVGKIKSGFETQEEIKNCKHEFGEYVGDKTCCVKCQGRIKGMGETWTLKEKI